MNARLDAVTPHPEPRYKNPFAIKRRFQSHPACSIISIRLTLHPALRSPWSIYRGRRPSHSRRRCCSTPPEFYIHRLQTGSAPAGGRSNSLAGRGDAEAWRCIRWTPSLHRRLPGIRLPTIPSTPSTSDRRLRDISAVPRAGSRWVHRREETRCLPTPQSRVPLF